MDVEDDGIFGLRVEIDRLHCPAAYCVADLVGEGEGFGRGDIVALGSAGVEGGEPRLAPVRADAVQLRSVVAPHRDGHKVRAAEDEVLDESTCPGDGANLPAPKVDGHDVGAVIDSLEEIDDTIPELPLGLVSSGHLHVAAHRIPAVVVVAVVDGDLLSGYVVVEEEVAVLVQTVFPAVGPLEEDGVGRHKDEVLMIEVFLLEGDVHGRLVSPEQVEPVARVHLVGEASGNEDEVPGALVEPEGQYVRRCVGDGLDLAPATAVQAVPLFVGDPLTVPPEWDLVEHDVVALLLERLDGLLFIVAGEPLRHRVVGGGEEVLIFRDEDHVGYGHGKSGELLRLSETGIEALEDGEGKLLFDASLVLLFSYVGEDEAVAEPVQGLDFSGGGQSAHRSAVEQVDVGVVFVVFDAGPFSDKSDGVPFRLEARREKVSAEMVDRYVFHRSSRLGAPAARAEPAARGQMRRTGT